MLTCAAYSPFTSDLLRRACSRFSSGHRMNHAQRELVGFVALPRGRVCGHGWFQTARRLMGRNDLKEPAGLPSRWFIYVNHHQQATKCIRNGVAQTRISSIFARSDADAFSVGGLRFGGPNFCRALAPSQIFASLALT